MSQLVELWQKFLVFADALDWGTLPQWASVVIAFLVFRVAQRFTERKAYSENLQYYNRSSQDINFKVFSDPEYGEWHRANFYPEYKLQFVQRVYYCFWILHFIKWSLQAEQHKVLRMPDVERRLEARLKRLVKRCPENLGFIFVERHDDYDLKWIHERFKALKFDPSACWTEEAKARAAYVGTAGPESAESALKAAEQ